MSSNQINVKAKKRYGQNFLKDQKILKSIIDCADLSNDIAVIEIGPGLGALTELLCQKAGKVLAYEIDNSLIPLLEERLSGYDNYHIINQDILKADLENDIVNYFKGFSKIYVVANLPYYITTPIIMGLLSSNVPILKYVVMMQLEVADRICGKPQTKDYNALSVMVAYKAIAKKVLFVPRTAFVPAPNVDSAVVLLTAYDVPPFKALNDDVFNRLLRVAFTQRRKTIYNNLILEYDKEFVSKMLEDLNYKKELRAEALTLTDFIAMSDYITQNQDI